MIIYKTTIAVRILVSALFPRHMVVILNSLDFFWTRHCIKDEVIEANDVIKKFSSKSVRLFIGILKQSKISELNSTKPEVFLIFSKCQGQGIGLQLEVKVNASFLKI